MKLNRIITLCAAVATLAAGTTTLLAQDNNRDNGRRQRWDPAQMQQRIMERYQQVLGFTNDTEWDAVKPLVQKVMDARRDTMSGMGRGLFGPRNRGGERDSDRSRRGGFFGQPDPQAEALQKAIDDNAPTSQIKDLLTKYRESQKAKQTALENAQANLKKVLTPKQEAQAVLLGLVQ